MATNLDKDEEKLMRLAKKRLLELKTGKAKTFNEEEFREFMKREGIE